MSIDTILADTKKTRSERARVLVVDDQEDNRDLLCRRLEREGHDSAIAENGQQALELLESDHFDLVLLDINMPVMDGFETLEQMKCDMVLKHIPVIVVSALDEEAAAVRCIGMGADDYLTKPFKKTLLKARIDACLQKKRARDLELEYRHMLDAERRRADELLYSLFPASVIQELKGNQSFKPRRYNNVAILFCDIVGFTSFCDHNPDPAIVVSHLEQLVGQFECITKDSELEKIKTIGDAYMAAANLSMPLPDPVMNCVQCGMAMLETARRVPPHWDLRVGIHCGPVVAGIIGTQKYSFDIWGDTVNTASRVESHGEPGAVNVSAAAWEHIAHLCRGKSQTVDVKGKGPLEIVRVTQLRSAPS